MDGTEVIDQPSSGEATAKADAGGSATGQVAPEGTQGQETNAGGSQEPSESGKEQETAFNRPRFVSKQQQLYELKQKLRERDAMYQQMEQRLTRFEQMFQKKGQDQKPSRTFWEAPEEVLEERLTDHLSQMEERLAQKWDENQTRSQETQRLRQETSEAAKFIRGQKGITDDDIQEIRDLLVSDPRVQRLSDAPMEQAEYVLYLYNKNKGVTDKTGLKNRAASVQGAPPQSGGPKVWTESEMEQEYNKHGDPKVGLTPEQKQKRDALRIEFRKAYSENRVKKQ
jgi:hypothetical protein